MRKPQTEDLVELIADQLEGALHMGNKGTVCSIWFMPNPLYEVEFQTPDEQLPVRALLKPDQFRIVSRPQLTGPE